MVINILTLKLIGSSEIAAIMASSPSKTRAGPANNFCNHCHLNAICNLQSLSRQFLERQYSVRNMRNQTGKEKVEQNIAPEKYSPSFPVIFATEPWGARFPYSIWIWPVSLMGFVNGLIICWRRDKTYFSLN